MGHTTWASTASSESYRGITRDYVTKGSSDAEIFTQSREQRVHKDFDPNGIVMRESCDSVANPNSTPIIMGLDVTGSMGMIPSFLVRQGFGPFIESLLDSKPISDPHIMMMALGDLAAGDRGPLQASQFETDIRIVEQLTQLWIEKAGGGNGWESYDLAWLFAGLKTKTDCWDKRGKRGYLFTFGDEPPPPNDHAYSATQLKRIGFSVEQPYTTVDLLKLAMQRWAVFHFVIEEGSHAMRDRRGVLNAWNGLFSAASNQANIVCVSDYTKLPEIMTAVLRVAEGADPDDVILQAGAAKDAVAHAFGTLER